MPADNRFSCCLPCVGVGRKVRVRCSPCGIPTRVAPVSADHKLTEAETVAPWAELARLHPRLCPRQVLGVRIGQHAGTLLSLSLPRSDKRVLAIVETDGCFADGVSVAAGCWLGHPTLRLVDYGKVAATFIDLECSRAIRIWRHAQARALAERQCYRSNHRGSSTPDAAVSSAEGRLQHAV